MTVGRIFTKIYIFLSLSWAFFRKPEKLGSHTGSKWWPGRERWLKWPIDPVQVWCIETSSESNLIGLHLPCTATARARDIRRGPIQNCKLENKIQKVTQPLPNYDFTFTTDMSSVSLITCLQLMEFSRFRHRIIWNLIVFFFGELPVTSRDITAAELHRSA